MMRNLKLKIKKIFPNYYLPITNYSRQRRAGFTLIEIIIAMAILAIVTRSLLGAFTKSQARGRDAQRKSDLKQLQNAFEAYANDHNGKYPDSDTEGRILGCPNENVSQTDGTPCDWEGPNSQFGVTDGAIYMARMVKDPRDRTYFYVISAGNIGYKIYACLENEQDLCFNNSPNCSSDGFANTNCEVCPGSADGNDCNYGVASSNEKLE